MDRRIAFLENVDRTVVRRSPYAYFHVAPAIDPALYQELEATFPDLDAFTGGQAAANNVALRIPAHKVVDDRRFASVWRDFFRYHVSQGFWDQMRRLMGPEMREAFPDLERQVGRPFEEFSVAMRNAGQAGDLNLDCQFVVNTPVSEPSSVKTAHVDNQYKLWSALLYFRHPEDDSSGGDFDIYRFVRPRRFISHRVPNDRIERCETVNYGANSFLAFVNSPDAVHGVSPRGRTAMARRYINFIAELRVKAFDLPQVNPFVRFFATGPLAGLVGRREPAGAEY